jgi:hypothetical protein
VIAAASSVSAGRLRYDHRSFEKRFIDLRLRSDRHGWGPLLAGWTVLADDVVRHFAFEELSVFPGFVKHRRGDGGLIRTLLDEHESLRRVIDELSTTIACGQVDPRELDAFTAAMGSHELIENTRIDPWLEQQDRRHDPRGSST